MQHFVTGRVNHLLRSDISASEIMNLASGFNRHPFAADRAQPLLPLKNVQQLYTSIQSVAQLVRLAFLKVHLPFEGKGICFGFDFHKSLYFPIGCPFQQNVVMFTR